MNLKTLSKIVQGYQAAVPHPRQRLPRVIQFPVNDICNSQCQMCHIWKQKLGRQITPDEIRVALANPLYREVTSVGINGGEPTLRKDLAELVQALIDVLPKLERINLITNAIVQKRVKKAVDELADTCGAAGVHLDVMVSLDGIGDVHDRVRGIKGNFASALGVLDHIQTHAGVQSYRIGCTVIRENVYHVEEVLDWCQRRDLYARFRIGIPHQRLYGKDIVDPFAFTWEERFHFANFIDHLHLHYERQEGRRAFYRSLRDQVIYGKERKAGCSWKNEGVTLLSDGGLAYCAVESKTIGNVIDDDSEAVFWANADHLSEIVEDKCKFCLHDYEGFSDRSTYVQSIGRAAIKSLPQVVPGAIRLAAGTLRVQEEKRRLRDVRALAAPARRSPASGRVLICGWYGTETLGDKAILGGIVDTLRLTHPDAEVDVAAIEPYITENTRRQMPELRLARILSLAEARTQVKAGAYGLVVMGGGPLMTGVSQCIDMLELLALGRAAGAATLVAGCGIGPLGGPRDAIVRELLETADRVLLRDRRSIATARNVLGWDGEAGVMLDPAFLWIARQAAGTPVEPTDRVLLALRDWPVNEYAAGLSPDDAIRARTHFEEEVLGFADGAADRMPGAVVIPFCMHKQAVGGDDRMFYRRLLADRPALLARLDDRHRPPAEDLAAFRSSRLVVAMRFHSVVFAIAAGRPFLAIDYTLGGKIAGLLDDLGLADRLIALTSFNADDAWRMALAAQAPPSIQSHLDASRQVLSEAFIRLLS
ncbi:MAG: polysaccharide pyruvyl transferase family protein [Rhodothermales bacterium]|nr:polysaccharide pyruvyl transferase family protein [Rhodothermales bacterium]